MFSLIQLKIYKGSKAVAERLFMFFHTKSTWISILVLYILLLWPTTSGFTASNSHFLLDWTCFEDIPHENSEQGIGRHREVWKNKSIFQSFESSKQILAGKLLAWKSLPETLPLPELTGPRGSTTQGKLVGRCWKTAASQFPWAVSEEKLYLHHNLVFFNQVCGGTYLVV